jgi:hypothetical protein
MTAACDTTLPTHHEGWALSAQYAQHLSSLLWKVELVGAFQRVCLEEYDHQVEDRNRQISELRKGNRELVHQMRFEEKHDWDLNNEVMKMHRQLQASLRSLDETCT